ncbi:MAG: hypothetical protein JXQ72_02570 [Anaerolineae bacterium]|nr:hypothetical protein [Anaerolineae bacterium]
MLKHMTRLVVLVVLIGFVVLFGAVPFSTHAQDDGTIYGIVTGSADIRVGPDFAYGVIGRLPENASVVVIGRAGDFYRAWDGRQWLQIQFGPNRVAWIYARLVRTSVGFNSIPPTGRILPRNPDGRVPPEFDLSSYICDQWPGGGYALFGNFMAGDTELVTVFPTLPGANVHSVIVIAPSGTRTAFDSETNTATILLNKLPWEGGIYTWRVAPYWASSPARYSWQQVCLLRTGGTFEKPDTTPEQYRPDESEESGSGN